MRSREALEFLSLRLSRWPQDIDDATRLAPHVRWIDRVDTFAVPGLDAVIGGHVISEHRWRRRRRVLRCAHVFYRA